MVADLDDESMAILVHIVASSGKELFDEVCARDATDLTWPDRGER